MTSKNNPYTPIAGNDRYVKSEQILDVKARCPDGSIPGYQRSNACYPLTNGALLHLSSNEGECANFQQMNILYKSQVTAVVQADQHKGQLFYKLLNAEGKTVENKKVFSPEITMLVGALIAEGVFDQGLITYNEASTALKVRNLLVKAMDDEKFSPAEENAIVKAIKEIAPKQKSGASRTSLKML